MQRGIADAVKAAKRDGIEWVFIDTAPNMSASVTDAIRAATLVVVPCRAGVFDLDAIKETIDFAREARKPFAVVINAAPPRRQDVESPMVTQARESLAKLQVPVWGGQITQRANFSLALATGEGAKEYDAASSAAAEIGRLWLAIEKSLKAIHGAREAAPPCIASRRNVNSQSSFPSSPLRRRPGMTIRARRPPGRPALNSARRAHHIVAAGRRAVHNRAARNTLVRR